MNRSLVILALAISSFTTQATNLINDERVTAQADCFRSISSSYDSWEELLKRETTKSLRVIKPN